MLGHFIILPCPACGDGLLRQTTNSAGCFRCGSHTFLHDLVHELGSLDDVMRLMYPCPVTVDAILGGVFALIRTNLKEYLIEKYGGGAAQKAREILLVAWTLQTDFRIEEEDDATDDDMPPLVDVNEMTDSTAVPDDDLIDDDEDM